VEAAAARRPVAPRQRRLAVRVAIAPRYETHQQRAIGDVESVLDVGCGANSPVGRFSVGYRRTVGVDCFQGAIEASRRKGFHDDYLAVDALELERHIPPRSFDAVVAFDLIEHLERDQGLELLRMMEQVARLRVVIFTPNGFLEQEASDGNPFQVHRSGWTPEDFRARGYDVRGVHGLRHLRGQKGSMRWRPSRFWGMVSDLTQPVVYRRPSLAFHLLCIKEVGAAQPAS
jgi:SAM-dependent methyltransferase